MKKKFQAKLLDGKIIGPLPLDDILSFLEKHGIKENILAAEFPGGDWLDLSSFSSAFMAPTPEPLITDPNFKEFKFQIGGAPTPATQEAPKPKDEWDESTRVATGREFIEEQIEKTRVIEMPPKEEALAPEEIKPEIKAPELVEKIDLSGQTREFDIPAHFSEISQEVEFNERG
jgi:hypothetical protein